MGVTEGKRFIFSENFGNSVQSKWMIPCMNLNIELNKCTIEKVSFLWNKSINDIIFFHLIPLPLFLFTSLTLTYQVSSVLFDSKSSFELFFVLYQALENIPQC